MTRPKFRPEMPLVAEGGKASQIFRDYLLALDGGALPQLVDAANDAAAATAGVPINNIYRNGSVLMVRVA